ncbi:MAG TPA: stage II sporulation protein R [Candidatus Aphodocola excrementigallinarum]|uniref:Stage II sporulation protein R n=1 Tax=Candidatus Aphodocola excrementigallinarum TaxID=2840670 RepID=A0A9D1INK1_9FIRM|nr:stage II sporulation protein R [Candidatus Aphodocola excrementigallinarum]
MKKIILIILAGLTLFTVYNRAEENETIKIPDSAIRFRVLANSNSPRDQKIKQDIAKKMQNELYMLLKSTKNISEARGAINNNMDNFNNILKEETKDLEYSYTIDYGMHEFPEKEYKGVVYDEGYYESLLVTLGEGKGDNFWCVLFPPLCLMEAEETDDTTEVEYKSFIKEIIEKYF